VAEKPFAVRLRKARQQAGMTQRQAADAAGVSQPVWANLELGTRDPLATVRRIEEATAKLAKAIGCPLDDLLPPRAR